MNKIEDLFCDIGKNLKVFICGAITALIGQIAAVIIARIY
jgi:hypothetical protein